MNAPILEANNITISFKNFRLGELNFKLPPGYFLGIIGSNGSGKTTLIRLLINLLSPDYGELKLFGNTYRDDTEAKIKEHIGFVYEDNQFPQNYLARDFMHYFSLFYPGWHKEKNEFLTNKLKLDLNKKISNYSSGEKKRFALLLALSHQAKLLLLDEPTTNLDPYFKETLLELLKSDFLTEETSVIYSTHYTRELENCADYLLYLNKGEQKYFGETACINQDQLLLQGTAKDLHLLKEKNLIEKIIKTDKNFKTTIKKSLEGKIPDELKSRLSITPLTLKDLIINDYQEADHE